jgi:hypothetical protein
MNVASSIFLMLLSAAGLTRTCPINISSRNVMKAGSRQIVSPSIVVAIVRFPRKQPRTPSD